MWSRLVFLLGEGVFCVDSVGRLIFEPVMGNDAKFDQKKNAAQANETKQTATDESDE